MTPRLLDTLDGPTLTELLALTSEDFWRELGARLDPETQGLLNKIVDM